MRYIAAVLLLQLGGNENPSAEHVKKLLGTVGIETNDERLESLISELEGKQINDLISEGSSKLASVPSGGGGAVATTSGGVAAAPAEEKKEEKEEAKEESDEDMGFSLFE